MSLLTFFVLQLVKVTMSDQDDDQSLATTNEHSVTQSIALTVEDLDVKWKKRFKSFEGSLKWAKYHSREPKMAPWADSSVQSLQ